MTDRTEPAKIDTRTLRFSLGIPDATDRLIESAFKFNYDTQEDQNDEDRDN